MDKKLLKEFAMKSRDSLTSLVNAKLNVMHIAETINWTQSGELYQAVVSGNNIVLTISEKSRYDKLQAAVKAEDAKAIIEKAAYTWFNRIVAIRYMELNEMLPEGKYNEWLGIRVLSDKSNLPDPEILKASSLRRGDLDLQLDVDNVLKLPRDEEKFREVLFAVVKKLGSVMPEVFGGETENIDFLLPANLLGAGGFVNEILKLPTAYFDQVEVIGWLYQYYNQAEKDIAMKKKTAVEKDEIPYVTQIFTPDWIVKYMVENSLGRYWLEHGGDDHLATNWKYLVKSSKDVLTVTKKMPNIEDVTFIDPCAGSGHILVYAFEVFYQIYLSLGFTPAQIPEKILAHNIYGLDIDDRAKQLSILSALLVARAYDKDIFNKHVQLNITSITESNGMSGLPELLKGEDRDAAEYLIDTFRDAKEYGSILKVKPNDYTKLKSQLNILSPIDTILYAARTEKLIHQAEILSRTYTIAVTNPPYMNKYDAKLKTYINAYYPESKPDLFSVFLEVLLNRIDRGGLLGMITPDSWMFLTSYEKLRDVIFSDAHISSMYHLDYIFPDVVVHTTAFTIKKNNEDGTSGVYIRLVDINNLNEKPTLASQSSRDLTSDRRYAATNVDFALFPGKIIAYWASEAVKKAFKLGQPLEHIAPPRWGTSSGDKDKFVRNWQEVALTDTYLNATSRSDAIASNQKWFPLNKGGEYRKWYGNNSQLINWKNDGEAIKNSGGTVRNAKYQFKPCITWNMVSTGSINFRYKKAGQISDGAGPSIFGDEVDLKYLHGVLNSKAIRVIASIVSPTLNTNVGEVAGYPIINTLLYRDEVIRLVEECRGLSKADWDSFETSWDFERHPLIPTVDETKLADVYDAWDKISESRWNKLKENEERLNEIFIEVYGMKDELTKTVEDKYVSVRKAKIDREARSLLSYFVGVIFGRYRPDKPGLNYAGGDWNSSSQSSIVDTDNISPIMDSEFYTDDIIKKLRDFLVTVYGESTLHINLDWLANALGRRAADNAEDTIRRYFVDDFFPDHFREYGKRPIYWMLSSGKANGFKALFYLHRYKPNLVAIVRTQYLLNTQNIYTKRLAELEAKTALNNDELKLKNDLVVKLAEIKNYDALIAVAASKNIQLDLDDGVKVNYPKLSQCAADVKPGSEILEMKGVKL